jgi:hypothetical protein
LIVSIVGDISLDSINLDDFIIEDEVILILKSSDIAIGNLENPITLSENNQDLLPITLKSDYKSAKVLKNFTAVNLGNNHIFDFGNDGFFDTLKFLSFHNIGFFGAGTNKNEASSPFKYVKDISSKIAFISGTRWANAGNKKSGTASLDSCISNLNKLKTEGFFIVFYPHWGYEYILVPPPDIRRLAHQMIDKGVDLIVGTHPHLLQGYEIYRGKYIFYSLGNFVFCSKYFKSVLSKETYENTNKSAILKFYLNAGCVEKFEIHPILFNDREVKLASKDEKVLIIEEINRNSGIFFLPRLTYLRKYYSQTRSIVFHNKKIRNDLQDFKSKRLMKKLLILKGITQQDIKNRLVNSFLTFFSK